MKFVASAVALVVAIAGTAHASDLSSGSIDCAGIQQVMPAYLRQTPEELISSVDLSLVNGVVAVKYPAPRGVQINPWDVAIYGLLEVVAYCADHDATRLSIVAAQRDWLLEHLEERHDLDGTSFLVIPYDFAVEPWTSKPGWVSALSQSATLALLDHTTPKASPQRDKVAAVAKAFTIKNTGGGIYSDFGDGGTIWQEYATPEKTSDIINGDAASLYIVAHEVNRLVDFPKLQARLRILIESGKKAIQLMLPYVIPVSGKILYDFHGVGVLRDKSDYSFWLFLSVLSWMQESGDVSAEEVQRVTDLRMYPDGRPIDH